MNKITFVIKDKYLLANTDLHPKPISDFIPDWFKNMKPTQPIANVKSCPSFIEVYKEGFVIVAPHDYLLSYDELNNKWYWNTPVKYDNYELSPMLDQVQTHNNSQLIEHLPNSPYKFIFKLNLPMKVITPKGYSVRQLPLPYTYNEDYEILYGVFRSDKIHEINLQLGYKTDDKEIIIKAGEPLCVFVPFKREKFKLNITNKPTKTLLINTSKLYSSFTKNIKSVDYYKD